MSVLWQEVIGLLPAVVTGAGVGFLSGVFGVGGGFLLVPVLNILLGVEMNVAVGTGACQVLGPATTSILARRFQRQHLRLPLTILGGLIVGVFGGAEVLELVKARQTVTVQGRAVHLVDLVVLATYFLLLTCVGVFAIWEARRASRGMPIRRGWIAHWPVPPYAFFDDFDRSRVSITTLSWFGLGVGFLSGLLGMSGGLVLIPGLIYMLGMKTQKAVLSSLIIVWIVAFHATIAHAWRENIDLPLVMALLVGGTVGARLGSEAGQKLAGRRLRQNFGWLMLATALLIAVVGTYRLVG